MKNQKSLKIMIILAVFFGLANTLYGTLLTAGEPILPENLFADASNCQACHNGITESNGSESSFGVHWRASVMANASNDPYWRASVRKETIDHPDAKKAIEDKCATCHMPMARFTQHQNGEPGTVFEQLPGDFGRTNSPLASFAKDGVSCSVCHQIEDKNLGQPSSFTGGFSIDTEHPQGERSVYGPFDIESGVAHVMNSATGFTPQKSTHIQQAEFCATCHTLYTHALDENGNEIGELAEQVPFLEWKHSDFADGQSCQDCHMKSAQAPVYISSVLGSLRDNVQKHVFKGGNFFLLSMLGKFSSELQLQASNQELENTRRETIDQLQQNAATISVTPLPFTEGDSIINAVVEVSNLTGHKLPTAYPSRRVWIQLTVTDGANNVVFESGKLNDGKIHGNANDQSAAAFEPHYDIINQTSQVQIYEAILVDSKQQVTTGLLKATSYVKDNRIIPMGFDKKSASKDIAVNGKAVTDNNFTDGTDQITYKIKLNETKSRYTITAKLWYQPIGYRWAINLDGIKAKETEQFSTMYQSMNKDDSAVLLVETHANITAVPIPKPVTLPMAPGATAAEKTDTPDP